MVKYALEKRLNIKEIQMNCDKAQITLRTGFCVRVNTDLCMDVYKKEIS